MQNEDKRKKKSVVCQPDGLMWLVWLSLKVGSAHLGRQGQMGCVSTHTCGSESFWLCTFSEDCGIKLSLPWFFWRTGSITVGRKRRQSTHLKRWRFCLPLVARTLPHLGWLYLLGDAARLPGFGLCGSACDSILQGLESLFIPVFSPSLVTLVCVWPCLFFPVGFRDDHITCQSW